MSLSHLTDVTNEEDKYKPQMVGALPLWAFVLIIIGISVIITLTFGLVVIKMRDKKTEQMNLELRENGLADLGRQLEQAIKDANE